MTEEVEALFGFEHYGTRRRGDRFPVSAGHARQLEAKGLVKVVVSATAAAEEQVGGLPANPPEPAGEPSSVSPAGQVSPQTTLSESADGESPTRGLRRAVAE